MELTGRAVCRAGCFPQGDVERIAADRGVAGVGGFVADESEGEHVGAVVAGRGDRSFEADVTVGERAGLVGEQHVDVAEILDAHQPLDEHLLGGEPPRAGGQAGRHDGWQQLGGDADRDGEGEQHRVDDGTTQRDVDHEDRDAEHPADLGQQPGEAGEAELELGLGVAFPEPDGDPPELGGRPGRDHHGVGAALVHDGSHEQTRRQLGQRSAARHRLR